MERIIAARARGVFVSAEDFFERVGPDEQEARSLLTMPGQKVRFPGWFITGKVVGTKQGKPMEFLTFEDETGPVECTFFPEVYLRHRHLLHRDGTLLLEGTMEADFGVPTLNVARASLAGT